MSYYPLDEKSLESLLKKRGINLKVANTLENMIQALKDYDYFDEFEKDHLIRICQRQPGSICYKKSESELNKLSKKEIINGILFLGKTFKELRKIAERLKLPRIKELNRNQLIDRLNEYNSLDFEKTDLELYQICEDRGVKICMNNKNLSRNEVILAIIDRNDQIYCERVENVLSNLYKEINTYQKNIHRLVFSQRDLQHILNLYTQYQDVWLSNYRRYVTEGLVCNNEKSIQKYLKFKIDPKILNPANYKSIEKVRTYELKKIPVRSYDPTQKLGGDWQRMIRWLLHLLDKEKISYACVPAVDKKEYVNRLVIFGKNVTAKHIKENPDWKLISNENYYRIHTKKFKSIMPKDEYLNIDKVCKGKRYIFYMLRLLDMFPDNSMGHRNVVIVDTKHKTVERFEPHGAFSNIYDNDYVDQFMNMFTKKLGSDFKYLAPIEYCPYLGPQAVMENDTGYCVTWSTLYMHMRLINPDAPRSEIFEYLLSKSPSELNDIIRRYQTMIDKHV